MLTLEELREKKKALEEKISSMKAEEKFLEAEKNRLLQKLKELGFSSIAEAKEHLASLETLLVEKSSELDTLLTELENSTVTAAPVTTQKVVTQQDNSFSSLDDL